MPEFLQRKIKSNTKAKVEAQAVVGKDVIEEVDHQEEAQVGIVKEVEAGRKRGVDLEEAEANPGKGLDLREDL